MDYPMIGCTKAGRLEQRAVRAGWNIPPEAKQAIVQRQIEIATKSKSNREATAAARALASMESVGLVENHDSGADRIEVGGQMFFRPEALAKGLAEAVRARMALEAAEADQPGVELEHSRPVEANGRATNGNGRLA